MPVKVLVTVPSWPVNVVTMEAPLSPATVAKPLEAVASASVAPSETPVPKTTAGADGTEVSTVKVFAAFELLVFPAIST